MVDMTKFFARARLDTLLGPTLTQSEVDGCTAIVSAMTMLPVPYIAYALATAYLETNHTMHPIEEIGSDAYFFRMYDHKGNRPEIAAQLGNTHDGDGVKYHGRGYPQLTGLTNYQKATNELHVDFVNHPELALQLDNAAKIMRLGMTEGWFTGRKLSMYFPSPLGTIDQFTQARRIINGQDRAADIAGYAKKFQDYLA